MLSRLHLQNVPLIIKACILHNIHLIISQILLTECCTQKKNAGYGLLIAPRDTPPQYVCFFFSPCYSEIFFVEVKGGCFCIQNIMLIHLEGKQTHRMRTTFKLGNEEFGSLEFALFIWVTSEQRTKQEIHKWEIYISSNSIPEHYTTDNRMLSCTSTARMQWAVLYPTQVRNMLEVNLG